MKSIIKAFLGVMVLALVLATLSACNLSDLIPTTPSTPVECEHTGGEATCTEAALCEKCGESYGEALGHTEETIAGKEATCSEKGLTEGKKCSVCGEILVAQEEIAMLAHTEEVVEGKEATCTEKGLTEGKKCSVCGEILVAQEEIAMLAHTEEVVEGKEATCTEKGLTEGKKCSVCGEVLVAQEETPKAAHTEEAVAGKDATCTETGLTEGKKCSVCGEILVVQEEIPSNGHQDLNADYVCDICTAELCVDHIPAEAIREREVSPTCEKEGSYDLVVKCSKCGDEISRESKSIDKLPHTEEVVAGKEATCTETGLTEGKKCSVCGEILVAQEETPKAAHTEEVVAGKDATCTETGLTDGKKCSVCGEILVAQEETPKAAHTEEVVAGKDATCTETGLTDGKKCSVCGEVLVAQEEIPAGHKFVDGSCTGCGLISNILAGKGLIPASDAAANIYSASYGYGMMNDGNLASRYSSIKNGGKVEAVIDLGAVYDLYEFKVLLYDYNNSAFNQFGTGVEIQVLFGGEWKTVVDVTADDFKVVVTGDQNWLTFDLGGANARQVKFIIPEHGSAGWSTFWEIECSAKVSSAVEPEPEEPVFIENVFAGKQFTPTASALASVLNKSWWKGSGYEGLTDGIKNADNAPGRFSTAMALTGMMDSTIDLGGSYELHSFRLYTYDPAAGTGAGSVGADLLIQVYADGEWKDVVICADNASIMSHLVANDGIYNDYLEFDLGGVVAEKVRFYISASASSSGTTFEEVECSGYEK